jgi:hypothetical protein
VNACAGCAAEIRPGARFCTRCGTPVEVAEQTPTGPTVPTMTAPPPAPRQPERSQPGGVPGRAPVRPSARIVTAAVVAVLVLAGAGGAAWYFTQRDDTTAVAAPIAPAAPSPPGADQSVAPAPASLDVRVASDRSVAESVVGSWVPQIAAKQAGLVENGTYDDARILQEFQDLERTHPDAILVRSDDYSTFRRPGFWVVLVATPYSTAAEVNAWCDANGFDKGDCFAKRLSHTEGPEGNTVAR